MLFSRIHSCANCVYICRTYIFRISNKNIFFMICRFWRKKLNCVFFSLIKLNSFIYIYPIILVTPLYGFSKFFLKCTNDSWSMENTILRWKLDQRKKAFAPSVLEIPSQKLYTWFLRPSGALSPFFQSTHFWELEGTIPPPPSPQSWVWQ